MTELRPPPVKPTDRSCQCFGQPINWISDAGCYECGLCKARWPRRINMSPDPDATETIARLTAALRECEAALQPFATHKVGHDLLHDADFQDARKARAAAKQALGEGT